jgi:hypothetical protein
VSQLAKTREKISIHEEHRRRMTSMKAFVALLKKHRVNYGESFIWDCDQPPFGICPGPASNRR